MPRGIIFRQYADISRRIKGSAVQTFSGVSRKKRQLRPSTPGESEKPAERCVRRVSPLDYVFKRYGCPACYIQLMVTIYMKSSLSFLSKIFMVMYVVPAFSPVTRPSGELTDAMTGFADTNVT